MGGKNHVSAEIAFALYLAYFRENRRNGGNLANSQTLLKNLSHSDGWVVARLRFREASPLQTFKWRYRNTN